MNTAGIAVRRAGQPSAPADGKHSEHAGHRQYRVGAYAEALETLRRCDRMNREDPCDSAFIAIDAEPPRRKAEAHAELSRLHSLMRVPNRARDRDELAGVSRGPDGARCGGPERVADDAAGDRAGTDDARSPPEPADDDPVGHVAADNDSRWPVGPESRPGRLEVANEFGARFPVEAPRGSSARIVQVLAEVARRGRIRALYNTPEQAKPVPSTLPSPVDVALLAASARGGRFDPLKHPWNTAKSTRSTSPSNQA